MSYRGSAGLYAANFFICSPSLSLLSAVNGNILNYSAGHTSEDFAFYLDIVYLQGNEPKHSVG